MGYHLQLHMSEDIQNVKHYEFLWFTDFEHG